ncbi:thiamine phosphate synthase [Vibrio sp. WJH972]
MVTIKLPNYLTGLMGPIERAFEAAYQSGLGRIEFNFLETESHHISACVGGKRYIVEINSSVFPLASTLDSSANSEYELVSFNYLDSSIQVNHPQPLVNDIGSLVEITCSGKPGEVAERWHISGEDPCELSSASWFDYSSEETQAGHLGWFVASLCLNFSVHDSLLLAHLGRNVSRETWVHSQFDFLTLNTAKINITINQNITPSDGFPAVDLPKFNLYPVVSNEKLIHDLIEKGVTTVQFRDKSPSSDYELQLERTTELSRAKGIQFFVNDYWHLAIRHNSYGVHLGQEDISTADLTAIKANGMRLGVSTHSYYEIVRALSILPSYIALGHIFPTTTKEMPSKPQGLERLKLYNEFIVKSCEVLGVHIPTCAIGGIDITNAQAVLDTGVDSIAVVRAITESNDLDKTLHHFDAIQKKSSSLENGVTDGA